MAIKRYRVKVVIKNSSSWGQNPTTKYVIQKRVLGMWFDDCDWTTEKEWAYKTCEEMNMPYNEMRDKQIAK